MTQFEVLPSQNHPSRPIFERAYRNNNQLVMMNTSLDVRIEQLQAGYVKYGEAAEITKHIALLQAQVSEVLDTADSKGVQSWNDYYRLLSRGTFLTESVLAPSLFTSSSFIDERKQLVNGVAGLNAEILGSALAVYDSHQPDSDERAELKGVINEHTTLSLLNNGQTSNRLALPASITNDLLRKTDIVHRYIDKDESRRTNIQVKSNAADHDAHYFQQKGIVLVTNETLENTGGGFRIARLLVKENQYGLDGAERHIIKKASERLIAHVESQAK